MTTSSSPFDPQAEELFLEFLARRDAGEQPDIEAVCGAHPAHATQLRQMLATYDALSRLRPRASDAPLSERLKQRFGDGVDPDVSLGGEPQADSGPQSKLFERLRAEGPRGTRYKLLGEVARGGMGAILKIWDEELRRTLAMKVVLGRGETATGDTPAVDPKTLGRFLEEAQITGQLDHPGIVPVHELGLDATGRVYFTMKLVKGEDLRAVFEHVKSGHDGWNQVRALGVLLRVCEAMAFAHSKQVVHRDLKPANVMVGKFGEVYVMDWGLARVLGREDKHDVRIKPVGMSTPSVVKTERHDDREGTPDSPLVTMDGDVVGTPSFMPPEQARGELDKLGPHSDVYSIGAMLYQLVTGEMPYVPAGTRVSQHTILLAVLREPPPGIEKLAPATPAELVAICERAMERDIAKRYPTTLALAADLRAYLEGRVVSAYETGRWAETKKWVQRNKALAASLAAVVLTLIAGVLFSLRFASEANAERERTQTANVALDKKNAEIEQQRASLAQSNSELRAQSREQKLRGMIQDLARLRAQSRTLEGLGRLGKPAYLWWIEESEKLLNGQEEDLAAGVEWRPGLKDVRAKLAELHASDQVLPYSDEDRTRDFESHPERKRLRELETKLQDTDTSPADKTTLERESEALRALCGERRTWRFKESQVEWWHSLLVSLESDLAWQARMLEVAKEAAFSEKAKSRWAEAIEGIARSAQYAGQKWRSGERLTPQLGLLPLGENPATGLWEFVHLQTGTEPQLGADGRVQRDSEGRLTLTPETGMVLVLLPGGRVPKEENQHRGQAEWITGVDLDPFFLSKYELTHEQWDRVSLRRGFHYEGDKALIPANIISWDDIALMLQRDLGWCGFPSEAQWEYGCRARTNTAWWPGDDAKGLLGVANIELDENDRQIDTDIAPVGTLRANAFGLHDVHGNVLEWCADTWDATAPPRKGDGLRDDGVDSSDYRVLRGGSWGHSASAARSANRDFGPVKIRIYDVGLRPSRGITP
ncbi:MAG: SUMF1/EgtB/PvdO family nonheme iron enzyme [Planctomycetes bacterium]|nr:SUMF1/EgtB/PvdO family nonheme iron enzyme [Planctomycetota bacterium]